MLEGAPAIFVALEGSALGHAIRQSTWAYMTANVGHILSLAVFAGVVAVMDGRMALTFSPIVRSRPCGSSGDTPWVPPGRSTREGNLIA